MTEKQRELARHALGFPNKRNQSYRNHFCTGPGSLDFDDWEDLVAKGLATKRTIFYLTLKGALMVCGPKEYLSREDATAMRRAEGGTGADSVT